VTDIVLCEDGHAQERSLVDPILALVEKGSLWVADQTAGMVSEQGPGIEARL
jgi:hypothetical protein